MEDIHGPSVSDTSVGMYHTLEFGGASFLYHCRHLVLTCLQISELHTCQNKRRPLGVSRPLEIFGCKSMWQTRCTCWIGGHLLSRSPGPRLQALYRSACINLTDRFVSRVETDRIVQHCSQRLNSLLRGLRQVQPRRPPGHSFV